jgi:hypothetical protein
MAARNPVFDQIPQHRFIDPFLRVKLRIDKKQANIVRHLLG